MTALLTLNTNYPELSGRSKKMVSPENIKKVHKIVLTNRIVVWGSKGMCRLHFECTFIQYKAVLEMEKIAKKTDLTWGRKICSFTKMMHRLTVQWKQWQIYRNYTFYRFSSQWLLSDLKNTATGTGRLNFAKKLLSYWTSMYSIMTTKKIFYLPV